MGSFSLLSFSLLLLISITGYQIYNIFRDPIIPKLNETWWGSGASDKQDVSIRPFKITINDEVIADLQWRLDNARPLTPPLEGTAQEYGMNSNLLNEVINFWKTQYKWKKREVYINKYPHFYTNIQGLDIHFILVKPKPISGVKILPLLLLHGWPGSVLEFYDIIPLLTEPQPGERIMFEVVVAAIPGYGFSKPAVKPGLGCIEVAVVMKNLMLRLGFEKFYIQGGDMGGIILRYMSSLFPEHVIGFHNNMCAVATKQSLLKQVLYSLYPNGMVKEGHEERLYPLFNYFRFYLVESGYLHIQSTKPDTLGAGVNDSPVALASYVLEKFVTGINFTYQQREDGGLKETFGYDKLIDNLMMYWLTGSATTSFRLYSETFTFRNFLERRLEELPVNIPSACARFRYDIYTPDGTVRGIYRNLLQLSDYEGGHFAALQFPEVLAKDLYAAVNKFEQWHQSNHQ